MRALEAVGVRKSDRLLLIAGVRPRDPRDSKLVGRALSALRLQRSRRDVHVLLDPEVIADEYRRYRPDVLSASPSILIRLAEVMPESERRELRPRLILSAGEVLAPDQRVRIEQELGAPVRNVYSSFEMGVLAWECPATGAMHTSDDSAIVEVLVDGRPATPGETGEVVATNLHAFASPFLRYRQGDLATRGATTCACGESFSTISEVQGREVDLLPLPDGTVLHPYRLARALTVSGKGAFRQFQITQERLDRIVLRVVPAGEAGPQKLEELRAVVQPIVGSGVELVILVVEDIPLEPGGKFRVARSLVGAEPFTDHATVASGRPETFT
jgi:phenylacetate-CoA ligase